MTPLAKKKKSFKSPSLDITSKFRCPTWGSWTLALKTTGQSRVSSRCLVSKSLPPTSFLSFFVNLSRTPRCRGKLSYRTEVQQVAQLLVGPYSGHALLLRIHLRPLLTGPKVEKEPGSASDHRGDGERRRGRTRSRG